MKIFRQLIRLIPLVLAVIGMAGCSAGLPQVSNSPLGARYVYGVRYIPASWATKEYFAEADHLTLAAGSAWPKNPLNSLRDGDPQMYGVGFGKQAADSYWFCSWSSAALHAPDQIERNDAVRQLLKIRRLYYYTTAAAPALRSLLNKELNRAKKGKMSMLRADVSENCAQNHR
jgi:hypothetical protein